MSAVLHLLKGPTPLAADVIARQRAAGDEVTVALLPGAGEVAFLSDLSPRRVPEDLSFDALLALIYAADQVIAW
jgi:hypothetical protein